MTREAARRFGDATAYVAADSWPISYRELDRVSDELAMGLQRRGLGAGDVLALVLHNGPEYLFAYLAAAKLGAVTAGVNERLAPAERAGILEIAQPRLVLASPDLSPDDWDIEIVDSASTVAEVASSLRVAGEAPAERPFDPDDPVAILFTSGTTGLPKGALFRASQLQCITDTDVGDTWGTGRSSSSRSASSTTGCGRPTVRTASSGGSSNPVPRPMPASVHE